MPQTAPLVDRFGMGVDVERFSDRNTHQQQYIQRDLDRLLSEAANTVGLDRSCWDLLPSGDGELAVLPPDADQAKIVGQFVSVLSTQLTARNEDHAPEMKIRLRVAMHSDAIMESTFNYAGPALIHLSRLLDSTEVRHALKQAEVAPLALIVSEDVYRKVVGSGLTDIRPEQFRQVRVCIPAKRFDAIAYVHVPGYDVRTFRLPDGAAGPARAADGLPTQSDRRTASGTVGEETEAPGEQQRRPPGRSSGAPAVQADHNAGQVTTILGDITGEQIEIGTLHFDRNRRHRS